jgi:hypothetical protein
MNTKKFFLTLAVGLMLTACSDVMNKTNLSQLLAEDIWEDPYLVGAFLDQICEDNIPKATRDESFVATEERYGFYATMSFIWDNYNLNDDVGDKWSYKGIRSINKFLENVDRCPSEKMSDAEKEQCKGQMLTLRGWLYFNMVRLYGGVPLILHEQSPAEDLYVRRAKTSECIEQIVRDFDEAIALEHFPMRWADEKDAGRLSKALAMAMKGRVLLYYASPQFSHKIGVGTKDAQQRWQEAYEACREAKDRLAEAGYALFKPSPANHEDAVRTFYEMFFDYEIPANPEIIGVRRYFYPNFVSTNYDQLMRPTVSGGVVGSGSNDGTIEYANAFLNADGSPFTALSVPASHEPNVPLGQSTTAYWIGREPRFYAYVAWNGCIWPLYRQAAFVEDLDEEGRMRHQWAVEGQPNPPFQELETSQSGAIKIRKMVDINQRYFGSEGNRCGMDWIFCRYAEVLLNFAETAVKTGREAEALEALQAIRRRAGIPQGDQNYGLGNATGDALLVLILKERLLELSHEGECFRFYDLRRWRLYTDDIAGYTMKGFVRHTIRPRFKAESYNRQDLAALDVMNDPDAYFDLFEDQFYTLDSEPFNVSEREYFFHLSFEGHIRRNPNLEQTMGWEGGTFDPYE